MEHTNEPTRGLARVRVGERLRAAREARELSLEDVASHTRVPKRLLELIEAGEHSELPAATYSAGFVKVYAQLVGLNGAELARQFREEIGGTTTRRHNPEPFEPADPARVPSRLLAVVALIVAVLIAGGYGLWRSGTFGGPDETARLAAGTDAPAAAPDAPVSAAPAAIDPAAPAPAATPPTNGPVVLTATDDVWFKVSERSGKTLYQGVLPAGQHFEVPADAADPVLRTGKPEALAVSVAGQQVPPLGAPSTLVREASLTRAALLSRAGAAQPPVVGTQPVPLGTASPAPAGSFE